MECHLLRVAIRVPLYRGRSSAGSGSRLAQIRGSRGLPAPRRRADRAGRCARACSLAATRRMRSLPISAIVSKPCCRAVEPAGVGSGNCTMMKRRLPPSSRFSSSTACAVEHEPAKKSSTISVSAAPILTTSSTVPTGFGLSIRSRLPKRSLSFHLPPFAESYFWSVHIVLGFRVLSSPPSFNRIFVKTPVPSSDLSDRCLEALFRQEGISSPSPPSLFVATHWTNTDVPLARIKRHDTRCWIIVDGIEHVRAICPTPTFPGSLLKRDLLELSELVFLIILLEFISWDRKSIYFAHLAHDSWRSK